MRSLLVLLAITRIAHAGEHDASFASNFGVTPDKVHDVVGYELPAGNEATHVVIGRFDSGAYVMTGALMLRCDDTKCTGRKVELGAADAIELAGIADLLGTPTTLSTRGIPRASTRYTRVSGARAMKFPVVAITTKESKPATGESRARKRVTGTETRRKLYLISLVEADRGAVVLMDTAEEHQPTGRGFVRSYRLDKGDTKGALDLIAKEQRLVDDDSRCLQPAPSEAVFTLEEHHYRTKTYALGKGC